jgi:hypothetical protein
MLGALGEILELRLIVVKHATFSRLGPTSFSWFCVLPPTMRQARINLSASMPATCVNQLNTWGIAQHFHQNTSSV